MSEQIVIQIDDKIDNSIAEKIITIGAAAQISNRQIEKLQKNLNIIGKNAIATERLAAAQNRTQASAARLSAASDRAAIAHLRLEAAQKRQVASARSVAASNASVGNSLGSLITRGLQIAAAYIGIREVVNLGNAYVTLQNKLKVVTDTEDQLAAVTTRLFEISNKTRAPIEDTVTAFSRFDLALKPLGKSQEEVLRMTETINKALTLSGATTSEAGSGLLQLSQAFNKGKLDGDEFRSVMELMPAVADAIAKQLKVTRGELLNLAPQGKITADVMSKALASAADTIDAKFAKTMPTIGQSFTILKNKAIETIGELEKRTGIFGNIATQISSMADSFLTLSPSIVVFATGVKNLSSEFFKLTDNIFGSESALRFLKASLQSAGFIAATIGETFFRINVELKKRDAIDYAGKLNTVTEKFNDMQKAGASAFELSKVNDERLKLVNLAIATNQAAQAMQASESPLEQFARGIEEAEKATVKLNDAEKLRQASKSTIIPTDKKAVKDAETRAKLLARINAELDKENQSFGMINPQRDIYLKMTEIELKLGDKKLASGKNGIKLTEDERNSILGKITAIENNKRVQSEMDTINENANGPLKQYNATIEASIMLLNSGAIEQDYFNKQLLIAKNVYINIVDPLHEINKQLKQESDLLGFVGQSQQIENRIQQIRNELLGKGIILTSDQEKAYKNEIAAILQKNLVNQEQNKIYDELIGKGETFKAQLEALTLLMNGGASNLDMSSAKISIFGSMFDGTQEAFDNQLKQREFFYSQVDTMRQKDLISEKTAFQLKRKADLQYSEDRLQMASTFFGNFAALQNSGSRQVFEIGKAAAIAQATIDGILGVQKALASLPPPFSYVMAASTAVLTATNIAKISSTQFGGGFEKGGLVGGGEQFIKINEKGNEFVMNAQATARNRPILEAMNKNKPVGTLAAGPSISVNIENYGTSKEFEVTNDEGRIRIIARDEAKEAIRRDVPNLVASEIANPNSSTSKSLSNNLSASRRR
jgi:tape measure domain-containing protein